MRKIIGLLLIFSVIIIGIGCEQEEVVSSQKEIEDDKVRIGMSFDSFVIERWQRDRDVFVATAKELGAEVNVQNANGNMEEQNAQIRYFIDKKVDVIVIIAIDSKGVSEAVREAEKAGIKVISYDRLINDADVSLYISFDNEKVGEMMGTALTSQMKENDNVVTLCGPMTDNNVEAVGKGFEKVIRSKKINIIGSMNADGWKPELAYNYMKEKEALLFKTSAIMCGNDSLASQTVKLLSERRMAGKVLVVGQDADLEACQRIVEGTQLMTVYKPVEKLAKAAAEYAVLLAEGKDLRIEDTINDGSQEVPYVKLEPIAVTADNMDEVIIDTGFHMKEDVYLNINAAGRP